MTALLPATPERTGVSAPASAVPAAFSRPLSFRVRIVAEPRAFCRVPPQDAPALIPPAGRVRALDTSVAAVTETTSLAFKAPYAAKAAAAFLTSQAANVAFFLSRRPSMLGAKHHGKFRA